MKLTKLTAVAALSVLFSSSAFAVPWCHRGTIVDVADVTWSGATTTAMASGIPAPTSVADPERYQVFHATNNYCQAYAGGGGPIWGSSVPGVGSVVTSTYAPYILTNTVNDYDLNMGVSFKCRKCYAIPPYEVVHDFKSFAPMLGTEGKLKYEEEVSEER